MPVRVRVSNFFFCARDQLRQVLRFLAMIVPSRKRHCPHPLPLRAASAVLASLVPIENLTRCSSHSGLWTVAQHGPIWFHGLCRALQTHECTCHLEITFFFKERPCAHRALFVPLESKEALIQVLRHPGVTGRQVS